MNEQWPDERVELFRSLWAEGKTVSEIAAALGVTRSAVAGKRARIGLPGRPHPVKHRTADHPVAAPKQKPRPAAAPKQKAVAATVEPRGPMITADQLTPHTCRFPIGDPGSPGFGFCGEPTALRCYCEYHHKRTHTKVEPRPENCRPKSLAQIQAAKLNIWVP